MYADTELLEYICNENNRYPWLLSRFGLVSFVVALFFVTIAVKLLSGR